MADRFTLPRVRANSPITDKEGKAVNAFVMFWEKLCRQIEGQENSQNSLIATIQTIQAQQAAIQAQQAAQLVLINQALELAGLALETADGGGPNKSGSATAIFALTGTGSVTGPLVTLAGVSAGVLTVPGTGPSQVIGTTSMTGGNYVEAEYDIVEVVSGVDTVVFTGTFNVTDVTGDEPNQIFQVVHTSAPDIAAFTSARASTGTLAYRVDVRRLTGATMLGMRFYLFARRAV